ncbi:MAG: tetratricopeptide repeat protein, partial [bacterium]
TLQKKLSKAKKYTEKALKMFKLMGNILNVAEAYHVFGLLHGTQGNYSEAELFLDESLKINEQKEYIEGLAETYESYGNLCCQQGQVKRSKEYYEKAADSYKKLNLHTKVQKLRNIIDKFDLNLEHDSLAKDEYTQK